jgi:hypothetical protein
VNQLEVLEEELWDLHRTLDRNLRSGDAERLEVAAYDVRHALDQLARRIGAGEFSRAKAPDAPCSQPQSLGDRTTMSFPLRCPICRSAAVSMDSAMVYRDGRISKLTHARSPLSAPSKAAITMTSKKPWVGFTCSCDGGCGSDFHVIYKAQGELLFCTVAVHQEPTKPPTSETCGDLNG